MQAIYLLISNTEPSLPYLFIFLLTCIWQKMSSWWARSAARRVWAVSSSNNRSLQPWWGEKVSQSTQHVKNWGGRAVSREQHSEATASTDSPKLVRFGLSGVLKIGENATPVSDAIILLFMHPGMRLWTARVVSCFSLCFCFLGVAIQRRGLRHDRKSERFFMALPAKQKQSEKRLREQREPERDKKRLSSTGSNGVYAHSRRKKDAAVELYGASEL